MRATLIVCFVFLQQALIGMNTDEADTLFALANEAYSGQDFEKALDYYTQIAAEYQSCALEFNLGNTYMKLNDIGHAILHYERAMRIDPNDEDLLLNLAIANQRVMDKIDTIPTLQLNHLWNQLVAGHTLKTWTWISVLAWFGVVALFAFRLFSTNPVTRRIFSISIVFLILVTVVTTSMSWATANHANQSRDAIIMTAKVDVVNEPNGGQTAFVLHEGTKIRIKRVEGDWAEVQIASGNVGWLQLSALEII
jgi:hypothetical protein